MNNKGKKMYKELSFYSGNAINSDEPVFGLGHETCFVDRYKLISAYIPMSFQSTNTANNSVAWMEGATLKTTSIPQGQYNLTTFPLQLQTSMNSQSSNNYVVTFDLTTRSLKIVGTSAFQILPGNAGTSMYKQMGVSRYNSMTPATTQNLGVSDFTANAPIMLTTSALSSENAKMIGFSDSNCLAVIPAAAQPGSFLEYTGTGSWLEAGQELSIMNFRLIDASTGNVISLNGNGYCVTIGVLTDVDDTGV